MKDVKTADDICSVECEDIEEYIKRLDDVGLITDDEIRMYRNMFTNLGYNVF